MTRDEAIQRLVGKHEPYAHAALLVDNLAALGVLKLDEPKSAAMKFVEAYYGPRYNPAAEQVVQSALAKAGLRIVEK